METLRLFFEDAYRSEFEATVIANISEGGSSGVILDRTCFYPLSGGQLPDSGRLNSVRVCDVTELEDGRIVHWLENDGLEGDVVGEVDWDRRFDHMQQHTGQHLLSRCFVRLLNAHTVSFHMGEDTCTIDLNLSELSPEMLEAVERSAWNVIFENRPVTTKIVPRSALLDEDFRGKIPDGATEIRLVEIEEFDKVGCCGTHVRRTGEIAGVAILGTEKAKGRVRVEFLAGERVLRSYRAKHRTLQTLGSILTTGEDQLVASVENLVNENKRLRKRSTAMEKASLVRVAEELVREASEIGGRKVVLHFDPDGEAGIQRELLKAILDRSNMIAVVGSGREKTRWICGRGEGVRINMTGFLQELLKPYGGKGGGSEAVAQGGGPGLDRVEEVLTRARDLLGSDKASDEGTKGESS